jgi:hypothetical protein
MHLLSSWLVLVLFTSLSVAASENFPENSQSKVRADSKYIVVLKPDRGGLLGGVISGIVGRPLGALAQFTLGAFSGFNAELSLEQLERLKKNPNVCRKASDDKIHILMITTGSVRRRRWVAQDLGSHQSGIKTVQTCSIDAVAFIMGIGTHFPKGQS